MSSGARLARRYPYGWPRSRGPARANEFAATTTRNPPSRIGGRGVRDGAVRAQAPSDSAVRARARCSRRLCVRDTGDCRVGSHEGEDSQRGGAASACADGLPTGDGTTAGYEHPTVDFSVGARVLRERMGSRGASFEMTGLVCVARSTTRRSAIEFSPLREERTGRGRGRGHRSPLRDPHPSLSRPPRAVCEGAETRLPPPGKPRAAHRPPIHVTASA
jgi:hypothetical protein